MITHQVRKTVFRLSEGDKLHFPNIAEVEVFLGPKQPFGLEAGNGHTGYHERKARAFFNANTGQHSIESAKGLEPLGVLISYPNEQKLELNGNCLKYRFQCSSRVELTNTIKSIQFGYPILLNLEFGDPPIVERIQGNLGGVKFRWELADWKLDFTITNQDLQEEKAAKTWKRFSTLPAMQNSRYIAALVYFHKARRLSRVGNTPWEFMSEIIINYSKVLEILFPGEKTIDAAREGLSALGYLGIEIESDFIPVLALRNRIDGAHADLTKFNQEQLEVIHGYTEKMETKFQKLLTRITENLESKNYEVANPTESRPSKEDLRIIDRMRRAQVEIK